MTPRLHRLLRATPALILSVVLFRSVGIWPVGVAFVLAQGSTVLIRRWRATRG
jgi:hypothetical protein